VFGGADFKSVLPCVVVACLLLYIDIIPNKPVTANTIGNAIALSGTAVAARPNAAIPLTPVKKEAALPNPSTDKNLSAILFCISNMFIVSFSTLTLKVSKLGLCGLPLKNLSI
jgi:hypothetical protein